MKRIAKIVFLLALTISFFGCKKQLNQDINPQYLQNGSLYDFLKKDPELTQFISLAKKTGYDSVLRQTRLYTVLAVKNGGFSNIDTNNLILVKRVIGIHIIPTAIYKEKMDALRLPSISGKYVKFITASGTITANSVAVNGSGDRLVNGVAYKVQTAIIPLPSIYEIISTDPNYSLYYQYVQNSFAQAFDPVNNIITKYDSVGKPVYKQPYKYIFTSQFIGYSKIDSEKVEQTVFIPTNTVVTNVLGLMLSARGGNQSLVIPALSSTHAEINIGGYFFGVNIPYAGDSTIVKNYLFRNTIVNGIISSLAAGTNTFTSKDGNTFTVSSAQVSGEGLASNGKYYILNDITLPGSAYRKTFMFEPKTDLPPSNPANPFVASGGAKSAVVSTTASSGSIVDRFTTFNLNNVGGRIDFTFPFVTKGDYQVVLRYVTGNSAIINTFFNGGVPTTLLQGFDTSNRYTQAANLSIDQPLGRVTVTTNGSAKFSIQCANSSPLSTNVYNVQINSVKLIPVD
ncbi:MAG: hypothetical protein JWQ34_1540 [Mucilaginibacter sp.]|uniref:fasciclin domain-containing protein n=1 Tax=Mucilaginibacter sp. TaxID=1882438 RepID=UPI002602A92A|nr:fasciclin domain-containing protein [Mucilaginibacter sp.]MDB5003315.1 hypothetical protein [Mucilaginibacter sp.]